MKQLRNGILFISLLLLVGFGFALSKYYPLVEASLYNKEISVAGVQLLMTEEELNRTLAKGEFVYGMGGNGWTFSDDKIFVMTSSVGLFKGKVASIETENSSHSILGIKVGDKYGTASSILEKAGFKESADGYFTKGNVQIQLYGGNVIAKLRINIQDPAYKNVVF